MNTTISVEDKKVFIKWIVRNHMFKRRECVWVLNYLLSHEDILENVTFIDDHSENVRVMEMTTKEAEGTAFRFYKEGLITQDAEKAFHDMRLHPNEKMYIQISFPDRFSSVAYLAVLEDIDHDSTKKKGVVDVPEEIEELVGTISVSVGQQSLMNEIDAALDNRDKELFMKLSGILVDKKGAISFSA